MKDQQNNDQQTQPALNKGGVSCRIYFVVSKLDKCGFTKRIESIDCTETKKMYVTPSRKISKERIMKIDSQIIQNHRWQHFYTYCLDGQQQQAINMLKLHIIENVKKIKLEVDDLYKWVL